MYIDLVTINLCPGQGGGGVKPSGTLEISENGIYDVYSYSSASVDVHPSASLSETYISNGNYNITGEFNGGVITVDVPAPQFVTETLNVSANGTYNPGEGVDGYSQVVVDVPQNVTGFTEKEITEGVQIVNLSNSASYVNSYAFTNNVHLQTVNLPNCISVGNNAFANCSNLTTVSLPECKTINSNVFINCTTLQSIYLPNVEYISDSVFNSCFSLSGVLSLPLCSSMGISVFNECSNINSVYIPLIKIVDKGTFYNCSKLSSVYMTSCEYINDWAFTRTAISEAIFPLCYEARTAAFIGCSSLKKASFPNCYIFGGYNGLFTDDVSLEELTLNMNNYLDFASRYTSFKLDNTKLASGIGSIYVQSWHYDKYITANGWSSLSERFVSVPVSSMLSFSNGLISGYTNLIEYSFNSYMGISYSEVIDVSLPNCEFVLTLPYTTPPRNAFREKCNNLQTLYVGLMSLCYSGFMSKHSNIRTVNLPVCTGIDENAFNECSLLSNIILPNVEYIGNYAFNRCSSLSQVNLSMCSYIGNTAFANCSSLSEISLPNVEYIDNGAFMYCPALTSINLPKCSVLIGQPFFRAGLTTLTLGYGSVVSISYRLETGITSSTGSIYVPASLVDSYKSAPIWSKYSNRIFPIE